jgi:hypothetical protein
MFYHPIGIGRNLHPAYRIDIGFGTIGWRCGTMVATGSVLQKIFPLGMVSMFVVIVHDAAPFA